MNDRFYLLGIDPNEWCVHYDLKHDVWVFRSINHPCITFEHSNASIVNNDAVWQRNLGEMMARRRKQPQQSNSCHYPEITINSEELDDFVKAKDLVGFLVKRGMHHDDATKMVVEIQMHLMLDGHTKKAIKVIYEWLNVD